MDNSSEKLCDPVSLLTNPKFTGLLASLKTPAQRDLLIKIFADICTLTQQVEDFIENVTLKQNLEAMSKISITEHEIDILDTDPTAQEEVNRFFIEKKEIQKNRIDIKEYESTLLYTKKQFKLLDENIFLLLRQMIDKDEKVRPEGINFIPNFFDLLHASFAHPLLMKVNDQYTEIKCDFFMTLLQQLISHLIPQYKFANSLYKNHSSLFWNKIKHKDTSGAAVHGKLTMAAFIDAMNDRCLHYGTTIAACFENLNDIEMREGNFPSSIRYSQLSIEWSERVNYPMDSAMISSKDYEKPLVFSSQEGMESRKNKQLFTLAVNYLDQGYFSKSYECLRRSLRSHRIFESFRVKKIIESISKIQSKDPLMGYVLAIECQTYLNKEYQGLTSASEKRRKEELDKITSLLEEFKVHLQRELDAHFGSNELMIESQLKMHYTLSGLTLSIEIEDAKINLPKLKLFEQSHNVKVESKNKFSVQLESLASLREVLNVVHRTQKDKAAQESKKREPNVPELAVKVNEDLKEASKAEPLEIEKASLPNQMEAVDALLDVKPNLKKKKQNKTAQQSNKKAAPKQIAPLPAAPIIPVILGKDLGFEGDYADKAVYPLTDPKGFIVSDYLFGVLDIEDQGITDKMKSYLPKFQEVLKAGKIGTRGESCIRPVTPKEQKPKKCIFKLAPKGVDVRIWGHIAQKKTVKDEMKYLIAFDTPIESHKEMRRKNH